MWPLAVVAVSVFFGTTRGYDTFLDLSCPASIWTFPMVQAVDSFAK